MTYPANVRETHRSSPYYTPARAGEETTETTVGMAGPFDDGAYPETDDDRAQVRLAMAAAGIL
jgi:hypothetical protein